MRALIAVILLGCFGMTLSSGNLFWLMPLVIGFLVVTADGAKFNASVDDLLAGLFGIIIILGAIVGLINLFK